jgi:hypothetical protein
MGVFRERRGQVAAGRGPASLSGARDGPPRGLRTRRGIVDLAVQAEGESSGGIFVETHGQTGQEPHCSGATACDAPTRWDR